MRARFVLFAAIALVSVLAACGGGGGGGSSPPTTSPTATATATTSPIATPSYNPFGCDATDATTSGARSMAVGVQPTTAGAAYSYTGTLTDTIVRSSPCPVGTSTAAAAVSINVAMTNATTETDTETDAYATNSDEYQTTATVGSSTVDGASAQTESAETTDDLLNTGTSTTTTYNSDYVYGILSPVPFTGGAISNGAPASVDTALADGSSEDRTYTDPTGAYTESDTPAGGGAPNTISVADGGAATYQIQTPSGVSGANAVDLSFGAPSAGSILVTITVPGSSPQTITIQQWFTPGSSLYTDQFTDVGSNKTIPCSTANDEGAVTGEEYQHTITNVDPALGSLDTRTVQEYVVPNYDGNAGVNVGPVCVVINDTENLYYDLFLDTPQLLYVSEDGLPFQTNTITESYWFSAAATGYLTRVRDESTGSVPGLAANVGAHVAGIAFQRSVERAERVETALANLRTYGAKRALQIKAVKGALK